MNDRLFPHSRVLILGTIEKIKASSAIDTNDTYGDVLWRDDAKERSYILQSMVFQSRRNCEGQRAKMVH